MFFCVFQRFLREIISTEFWRKGVFWSRRYQRNNGKKFVINSWIFVLIKFLRISAFSAWHFFNFYGVLEKRSFFGHADIPEITEIKSVCIRAICGKVCSLKILCFALREAPNVKKCIQNLGDVTMLRCYDVTMLRFSFLISTILMGMPISLA